MTNINDLKIDQLKTLLRENELKTSGSRVELIQRLTDHLGTDIIELPTISSAPLQEQINELREMMTNLLTITLQNVNQTNKDATSTSNYEASEMPEGAANTAVPERTKYTVKEIADILPEFDPTDIQSITVQQFVERVDATRIAYGWNEMSLLLAVYGRLKGVARFWLDSSRKMYTSWREFADDIQREFGCGFNEAQINSIMVRTTRQPNERVTDFCFRIGSVGKRFNLTEAVIIKYARDGIKHRELQTAIAAIKFDSLKEMRETCENFLQNRIKFSDSRKQDEDEDDGDNDIDAGNDHDEL